MNVDWLLSDEKESLIESFRALLMVSELRTDWFLSERTACTVDWGDFALGGIDYVESAWLLLLYIATRVAYPAAAAALISLNSLESLFSFWSSASMTSSGRFWNPCTMLMIDRSGTIGSVFSPVEGRFSFALSVLLRYEPFLPSLLDPTKNERSFKQLSRCT